MNNSEESLKKEKKKEVEEKTFYTIPDEIRKKEVQPKTSGWRNLTGVICIDESKAIKIWTLSRAAEQIQPRRQ